MKKVIDPGLLSELDAKEIKKVTDPGLLSELEGKEQVSSSLPNQFFDAVGNSPIGMVAKGAQGFMSGMDKLMTPFIPAESIQKVASPIFRGSRAAGVTASKMLSESPTIQNRVGAISRGMEAFKPDFQPQGLAETVGATAGEMAPVIAATAVSPTIAGPASMMAQQAYQTGKVSPIPALLSLSPIASKMTKSLKNRIVPPILKSTKGIPTEVSKMALRDESILDLPGTSASIQDKSQKIISGIKEAGRKVGDKFGDAYERAGIPNPVEEIISRESKYKPIFGKRNYKGLGALEEKTERVPSRSYQAMGDDAPLSGVDAINPASRIISEPGLIERVPGRTYKYMSEGSPTAETAKHVKNTVPYLDEPKDFNQLRTEYQKALSGELFKSKDVVGSVSEVSNNEKLAILTGLKRNLQDKAIYPPAGQQLSPTDSAYNVAIKKMASDIDSLRGKIPGGENLALADDAWVEMQEIKQRLQSAFKDPYTGQDYLNRIIKGNIDWLTSGRNAGRVGAIQRVEELTGKDLLQPALKEMAAAYINNPDILSLPSFGLKSIITSLIPTKALLKSPNIPPITRIYGSAGGRVGNKLPPQIAQQYLEKANYDKKKARENAIRDGWRLK